MFYALANTKTKDGEVKTKILSSNEAGQPFTTRMEALRYADAWARENGLTNVVVHKTASIGKKQNVGKYKGEE